MEYITKSANDFPPQEPHTHWTDAFLNPPEMLPRWNAQSVHKEELLYKGRLALTVKFLYIIYLFYLPCKCRSIYSGWRHKTLVKKKFSNVNEYKPVQIWNMCIFKVAHLILDKMAAHLVLFHSSLSSPFVFFVFTLVLKCCHSVLPERSHTKKRPLHSCLT